MAYLEVEKSISLAQTYFKDRFNTNPKVQFFSKLDKNYPWENIFKREYLNLTSNRDLY